MYQFPCRHCNRPGSGIPFARLDIETKTRSLEKKFSVLQPPVQPESKLLQLPRELRNMIYTYPISQLTFRIRSRTCGREDCHPKARLAFLRVCRQVYKELVPLWLRLATFEEKNDFSITSAERALAEHVPRSARLQIGYLRLKINRYDLMDMEHRIRGWLIPFDDGDPGGFADLALDTLTIHLSGIDYWCFIENLVTSGEGWRTLQIVGDPLILGCIHGLDRPQPSTWNHMLLSRDGAESGSSVTLYLSKQPHRHGETPLDISMCRVFNQREEGKDGLMEFGRPALSELEAASAAGKKIMVIVKRGKNVPTRRGLIFKKDTKGYSRPIAG